MSKVGFSLNLPPERAVAFLKNKGAVLKMIDEKKLHQSARANALRIKNLTSLEMTKDIYTSLEKAKAQGLSYHSWKKQIMLELNRKGWVSDVRIQRKKGAKKEPIIADPSTGEIFGTPRRLALIYRTNMQQAMSASRYQQYIENAENRPYWQYSAILDSRTRPSHSDLHGKVFRYDDPFWATFFPPNGFNCRCTVKALSARDVKRDKLAIIQGDELLEQAFYPETPTYAKKPTTAFSLGNGRKLVADRGFDYNVGRTVYKPNLDNYPQALAYQFTKVEMQGGEFAVAYEQIEQAIIDVKQGAGKLKEKEMVAVRNQLSRNFLFAAGVIDKTTQQLIKSNTTTVWLSDDTLIKQINSRIGQKFGVDKYGLLPDIIKSPDEILMSKSPKHFEFYKNFNGIRYMVVVKVLENELFVQSFRMANH